MKFYVNSYQKLQDEGENNFRSTRNVQSFHHSRCHMLSDCDSAGMLTADIDEWSCVTHSVNCREY